MKIALNLKKARINIGMSQEEASERLGISRQTLSNWERGLAYPDAVSLKKMCTLYNVSADAILECADFDYLKVRKIDIHRLVLIYLLIWIALLGAYLLFFKGLDMIIDYFYIYFLMPISTLCVSFIIGKNQYVIKNNWVYSLELSSIYWIVDAFIYFKNDLPDFLRINLPFYFMYPIIFVLSFIMIHLGNFYRKKYRFDTILR